MSVTLGELSQPLVLVCGLFLCWRMLTILRDNSASGLRSSEQALRDERQYHQQLIEKILVPMRDQGALAEIHSEERRHRIREDAESVRAVLTQTQGPIDPTKIPTPELQDLVNTGIG